MAEQARKKMQEKGYPSAAIDEILAERTARLAAEKAAEKAEKALKDADMALEVEKPQRLAAEEALMRYQSYLLVQERKYLATTFTGCALQCATSHLEYEYQCQEPGFAWMAAVREVLLGRLWAWSRCSMEIGVFPESRCSMGLGIRRETADQMKPSQGSESGLSAASKSSVDCRREPCHLIGAGQDLGQWLR